MPASSRTAGALPTGIAHGAFRLPAAQPNPLAVAYLTHAEVAQRLGASYFTAYSLGATGALGEPLVIGRTKLFPRDVAERAIAQRLSDRTRHRTGTPRTPIRAAR